MINLIYLGAVNEQTFSDILIMFRKALVVFVPPSCFAFVPPFWFALLAVYELKKFGSSTNQVAK
jgi:hypothetical protein